MNQNLADQNYQSNQNIQHSSQIENKENDGFSTQTKKE